MQGAAFTAAWRGVSSQPPPLMRSRATSAQQHQYRQQACHADRHYREAGRSVRAMAVPGLPAGALDSEPSTSTSASSNPSTRASSSSSSPSRVGRPKGSKKTIPNHLTWLGLGGADNPPSPFHVLGLTDHDRNLLGTIRNRNYSNLQKPQHQVPAQPQQPWEQLFQDPTLPLVVDVGCGSGRCVLLLAHKSEAEQLPCNFLGLDIHTVLMNRANLWAAQRGLQHRLRYLIANAAISLPSLLASYPGPVKLVCVQYPDPHVRQKRHVVHAEFVRDVTALLRPGAHVLLQSDIESTAVHMRDTFERYGAAAFQLDDLHDQPSATFIATPSSGSEAASDVSLSSSADSHADVFVGSRAGVSGEAAGPAASSGSGSSDDTAEPSAKPQPLYTGGVSEQALQKLASTGLAPKAPAAGPDTPLSSTQCGTHTAGPASTAEPGSSDLPSMLVAGSVCDDAAGGNAWVSSWAAGGWLLDNPVGAPTEREVFMQLVTGDPVYRVYLKRV